MHAGLAWTPVNKANDRMSFPQGDRCIPGWHGRPQTRYMTGDHPLSHEPKVLECPGNTDDTGQTGPPFYTAYKTR